VVVALVAATALGGRGTGTPAPAPDQDPAPDTVPGEDGEPVAVSSDAPRFATLADLLDASDVVVSGEVVATERGRPFGEPGGTAIVSRLVTLRVDEVLAGTAPAGAPNLLIEEEGWLDDGPPLVVDGAAPSEVGDRGIWFLVDAGDPELPVHVVVNAEGRYLLDDAGALVGADGDDPLIAEIEALTPDALAARVADVVVAPGG
jgi:hypothetical protein